MYMAERLVNEYATNTDVSDILNNAELVIIGHVNPDGNQFSWDTDRLWRKNRRSNGPGVNGVDLNRNLDDHWGEGGSSTNPASDTYMGPARASEPEIEALASYFAKNAPVIGGIDFHSYTQLVLRPYGWTRAEHC